MNVNQRIERFSLGNLTKLAIGKALDFESEISPDRDFSIDVFIGNAPCPSFVIIHQIHIGNLQLSGSHTELGVMDAFYLHRRLHLPNPVPLSKTEKFRIVGTYTGLVPTDFKEGFEFPFVVTAQGAGI